MILSKYISKFLSGSLLVSVGISFFGCSTSYMSEQKNIDTTKKKDGDISNFIKDLEMLKKKLARSHQEQDTKSFLSKKRCVSSFDKDDITFRLRGALAVKPTNIYLEGTKTANKKEFAKNFFDLNMLRIARFIYALEDLWNSGNSLNLEFCDFLDKVNLIKSEALRENKVTIDQLQVFNESFFKILDKINFNDDEKAQLTLNAIRNSLHVHKNYIQKGLFDMFKTLDYCQRTNNFRPEWLYRDKCPAKDKKYK